MPSWLAKNRDYIRSCRTRRWWFGEDGSNIGIEPLTTLFSGGLGRNGCGPDRLPSGKKGAVMTGLPALPQEVGTAPGYSLERDSGVFPFTETADCTKDRGEKCVTSNNVLSSSLGLCSVSISGVSAGPLSAQSSSSVASCAGPHSETSTGSSQTWHSPVRKSRPRRKSYTLSKRS